MTESFIQWAVVILLGAFIGAAEVCGRYRDAPWRAIRSFPSVLYIVINAGASGLAFVLCEQWAPLQGLVTAGWGRVLVAGIGGMALFRSSVFSIRAGDQDIGIGPSGFLQVFLAAVDREVDRLRAADRASTVDSLRKDLDPEKVFTALVPFCLALMQNVAAETQRELRDETERLRRETEPAPDVRMRMLLLALSEVVGSDVLKEAIQSLGDAIRLQPQAAAAAAAAN